MLGDVFRFAHSLGIQTCVGTETPLWIPDEVREKLRKQGRDPDDPAILPRSAGGCSKRVRRLHPLDFFWMWSPERPLDVAKSEADFRMICEVTKEMKAPWGVAVCGWGWLAEQFVNYHKTLPEEMAFSCINDKLGFAPVTPEFGKLEDRPRWCIPWMEDDTAMTCPQLFAGRVRKDAADAKRLGCTGLFAEHWRTRPISPNLAMLARSGWVQEENVGQPADIVGNVGVVTDMQVYPKRSLPTEDFYADWCQAEFGPTVGPQAAKIFARIDGHLPRPACWALGGIYKCSAGPGIIADPDERPWETVVREYAFVDELAALSPQVVGAGRGSDSTTGWACSATSGRWANSVAPARSWTGPWHAPNWPRRRRRPPRLPPRSTPAGDSWPTGTN